MNILIAGAGKVGYNITKTLSSKHNVTIIDKNEKALEILKESLEVLTIKGDMRSPKPIWDWDFYIAVTNNDEINLISKLIAEEFLSIKKMHNKTYKHSIHIHQFSKIKHLPVHISSIAFNIFNPSLV